MPIRQCKRIIKIHAVPRTPSNSGMFFCPGLTIVLPHHRTHPNSWRSDRIKRDFDLQSISAVDYVPFLQRAATVKSGFKSPPVGRLNSSSKLNQFVKDPQYMKQGRDRMTGRVCNRRWDEWHGPFLWRGLLSTMRHNVQILLVRGSHLAGTYLPIGGAHDHELTLAGGWSICRRPGSCRSRKMACWSACG